jgi:hypothetical protein
MIIKKHINLFLIFSFFKIIHPHGFGGNTAIQESFGTYWRIDYLVDYIADGQHLDVVSYDEFENKWITKKVKAAGFSESDYCCRLFFKQDINPLECTPLQLFYRVKDPTSLTATQRTSHAWVAAFKLKIGDKLICFDNKTVEVSNVEVVHEKLKVYTLEIKGTHTFLVTRHRIVAHNMLLPCGAVAGLTIPFDIACGASVGSVFGPVGICAGVVVGGAVACIVNACMKDRIREYCLSFKPKKISNPKKINNLYHFTKSVEDILKDTLPGRETKGKAKQYIKIGGYPSAVKDFENLGPVDIQKIKNKEGWVGTLPDGRTVIVREQSKEGRPTLEIQQPGNKGKVIKIRYDEK